MSIAQNFPNINPSLNLDFANVKALDPRVTFARASGATFYDGKTVAKAEENLVIDSGMTTGLSGVQSSSGNITAVSTFDTRISPNGLAYGDSTSGAITGYKTGAVASTQYTFSCFVVMSDGLAPTFTNSSVNNAGNSFYIVIGNASANPLTYSVTDLGSGLYRVSVTGTSDTTNLQRTGLAKGTLNESRTFIVSGYQLEQRANLTAYTPTTDQPITNYIPVLQTATDNVARFDHNPVTNESLGLLVEEQRTNLFTYSEQFDNAAWTKTNATVTANTIVAPDGTLTGDKFISTTDSGTHRVTGSASYTSGTAYTLTVYAKKAEYTRLKLRAITTATFPGDADFDLNAVTATASNGIASITAVGNDWYRCSLTATATATASTGTGVYALDNSGNPSFTGDGYSGIYIWGAQLEAGAFPTSYIPTVASQVTRSADAASMTGTNFSGWYSADNVGSVYSEVNEFGGNNSSPWWLNNGIIFRGIAYRRLTITSNLEMNYRQPDGTSRTTTVSNAIPFSQSNKVAISFNATDTSVSANGSGAVSSSSSNLYPVVDQLRIGFAQISGSSPYIWCGHIRKLSYYPARLTDAQLAALTS